MRLHFLGANQQVTGSRYCLETGGARVLIDCGMFQEREYQGRNWDPCPLPASSVDAVLLTHIHIDHSGLLPKFVREGFRGPIFATPPTEALAELMLSDAASIQEEDAAYKRKRHSREGRRGPHDAEVLFDRSDVRRATSRFKSVDYNEPVRVAEGVSAVFHDAGHILGSAMIEVHVESPQGRRTLLFSGDIGQRNKPIIRDPSTIDGADYLVMESTYGDRDHEQAGDVGKQLETILDRTLRRGGSVVIPTFAVERAQELMYFISDLVHRDRIPDVAVFLDSPMAVDVTEVFQKFERYFDDETKERLASNEPPLRFPGLRLTSTADQSKSINSHDRPCIIMSTSGMCNAGRIKHHLRRHIGRPESTILFVGYQSQGTLGRQILDGLPEVRIHGQLHRVRAEIAQIYGFSGHADRGDLLRWAGHFERPPRRQFLTHGELSSAQALAGQLHERLHWSPEIPSYRQVVELD